MRVRAGLLAVLLIALVTVCAQAQTPTLVSFTIDKTVLLPGEMATGTVTVSEPTQPGGLVIVGIFPDPAPCLFAMPGGAVVPTGQTSATFPIFGLDFGDPVVCTTSATLGITITRTVTLLAARCVGSTAPDCQPPGGGGGGDGGGAARHFRLIAENDRGGSRQQREVASGGGQVSPRLEFLLGELFRLRVVEVDTTGTPIGTLAEQITLGAQSVDPSPISSEFFPQPTRLFPSNVLIQFTAVPEQFLPVHSGTARLSLTLPGAGVSSSPITVDVQVQGCPLTQSGCFHLGTTANQFDDDIIRFADLRGIPPQIIKGHIDREARKTPDGEYDPRSYRYEPLSQDFACFSTDFLGPNSNCLQTNLRTDPRFSPYRLRTFADSTNEFELPQGAAAQRNGPDVTLRERYFVQLAPDGSPLPAVLDLDPNRQDRGITSDDELITMENVLFTNDVNPRHERQNWSRRTGGGTRLDQFRSYRRQGGTPFVGQTVIAASYGLMQMLYMTAVDQYRFTQNVSGVQIGRQPSGLFEAKAVIDLGTELVGRSFSGGLSFSTLGGLNAAFARAIQQYNRSSGGYGQDVVDRSSNFFPVR